MPYRIGNFNLTAFAGRPDILAAPTPDTVKAAAAKLGVDIEFFAGLTGLIQGRDYLGAYAEGKYAASTSNELDFMHDIQDDHLTSMVLGGEPLKEALMTSAGEALATDDEAIIDMRTADIDRFTATLRAVISAGSNLVGEAYGKESGRRTLINIGADIGLPTETVQKILETAQENAKKFGITPKELD